LSTNERISVGIFPLDFFRRFWNIFRKGERYIAESISERAKPWPTPTLQGKAYFGDARGEDVMIEQGKELGNVKCNNAGM